MILSIDRRIYIIGTRSIFVLRGTCKMKVLMALLSFCVSFHSQYQQYDFRTHSHTDLPAAKSSRKVMVCISRLSNRFSSIHVAVSIMTNTLDSHPFQNVFKRYNPLQVSLATLGVCGVCLARII